MARLTRASVVGWALALVGAVLVLGVAGVPERGRVRAPDVRLAGGSEAGSAGGGAAVRFQRALDSLQREAAAHPDNAGAQLALARLLHDGHRAAEAVPHYRRAIVLDPWPGQPYHDLAAALVASGELDGARAVLEERLRVDTRDAVAMYNLGAVEANGGDTVDAVRRWTEARAATTDPSLREVIDAALQRVHPPPVPPPRSPGAP